MICVIYKERGSSPSSSVWLPSSENWYKQVSTWKSMTNAWSEHCWCWWAGCICDLKSVWHSHKCVDCGYRLGSEEFLLIVRYDIKLSFVLSSSRARYSQSSVNKTLSPLKKIAEVKNTLPCVSQISLTMHCVDIYVRWLFCVTALQRCSTWCLTKGAISEPFNWPQFLLPLLQILPGRLTRKARVARSLLENSCCHYNGNKTCHGRETYRASRFKLRIQNP